MSRTDFIFECLCWPFQRFQRHVLAWVLAMVVTLSLIHTSLQDRVNGHETCDFAGQWMMGRTFFREMGPELYTVDSGKRMLAEGYQDKVLESHINDILKKGHQKDLYERGIGGALYPPTASILFSFLAQFRPAVAHAVAVFAYLLMCYGSGWMISRITRQRLQWGEATLLVLFFPNNFMGLMLGQNQALTLFILTAGWYCKHRGLPFVAGLVWGLFAYKPVFAVAMLLVPLALRSPRWFLGMALSGLLCVVGTLPYFGIEPWKRWFQVGRHAEQLYQVDRNWIWMSRDVVGLPRRMMWDPESLENVLCYNIGVWKPGGAWFMESEDGTQKYFHPMVWLFWGDQFVWEKHQNVYLDTDPSGQVISPWYLTLTGYGLLAAVAGITLLVSWRCQLNDKDIDGVPAVFLLTGSLLCVLHFMHYDLLSFALPVLIGLSMWSQWPLGRRMLFLVWYLLWLSRTYAFFFGDAILEIPWETFLLLILWAWMGVVTMKENRDTSIFSV
ncbi:MAG TPA: glycosyltransferase family 87 protein [Gemmatales bacterium]|nr:glycosyltransferase family 87 protein [Gemmatales bacterium]